MCVFPYSLSQIEYFRRSFRLLLVPGNSLLTPKIPKVQKIALLFLKGGLKKGGHIPYREGGSTPPPPPALKSRLFSNKMEKIFSIPWQFICCYYHFSVLFIFGSTLVWVQVRMKYNFFSSFFCRYFFTPPLLR